jgi:hypothetical protein
MEPKKTLTHDQLKTPRAAAVAGIVFSVLFIISLGLARTTVPADPHDAATWLASDLKTVALAIYLLPFAGIAFLWFIGVLRDRMGTQEDRFFATFSWAASLFRHAVRRRGDRGGSSWDFARADRLIESGVYAFGRTAVYQLVNVMR